MSLAQMYPPRLLRLPEFAQFQNAHDMDVNDLHSAVLDVRDQLLVQTATWGLQYWEEAFGITPNADGNFTQRRQAIMARMRGKGTVTPQFLASIAAAYVPGGCTTIDHTETYSFELVFDGQVGPPDNIEDIYRAIEKVRPAHLAVTMHFLVITLSDANGMTLADSNSTKLSKFAFKGDED